MPSALDSPVLMPPAPLLVAFLLATHIGGYPMYIEHFYSHSFIPDALKIDYEVENDIGIYYNVTAFRPFPGQLLMNVFVRKYNDVKGQPSVDVMKRRNLDFCKTLDRLRNVSNDAGTARPFLLQDTFVRSCPLVNGFYYVKNGTIPNEIVPEIMNNGRYLVNFELVQVINELIKLMNLRFVIVVDDNATNEN